MFLSDVCLSVCRVHREQTGLGRLLAQR